MKTSSFLNQRIMLPACGLLFLFMSVCGGAVQAAEFGRLFMTPQKRAELDEFRRKGEENPADQAIPPPPAPNFIRFDGLVLRSDGRHAAWLNGSRAVPPGLRLNLQEMEGIELPVVIINGGQSVRLKPGQRLNTANGEKIEPYATGPLPQSVTADGK